jgi:hypothetical protein
MNRLFGRLAALAGSVLVIIAFFLPWVAARTLETLLPLLSTLASLLNAGVGDIIGGASQFTSLTGLQLAIELPWVTAWFRLPVVLPLALGGLTLLWLLVVLAGHLRGGRAVDLGLACGCVVAGVFLVFNAGSIGHLDVESSLVRATMNALGLQLAAGYWLTLAALLLMTVGLVLGVSGAPAVVEEDDPFPY